MSDQPIDLVALLLREIQSDLADIKATMATRSDIVGLRREIMTLRSALVADIHSEFNLLHSRLDTLEQTRS